MSKIATELEAKTMGGGTLSIIDNKCCTKARALELGCKIKDGYSYADNQLVELSGIECATSAPIVRLECKYYGMQDVVGAVFDFRIKFNSTYGKSSPTPIAKIPITKESDTVTYDIVLTTPLTNYLEEVAPPTGEIGSFPVQLLIEIRASTGSGIYHITGPGYDEDILIVGNGLLWNAGNSTGIDRRITGDETLITDYISITKT